MHEENEWIDSEAGRWKQVVGDLNNRVGMWVFAKSSEQLHHSSQWHLVLKIVVGVYFQR